MPPGRVWQATRVSWLSTVISPHVGFTGLISFLVLRFLFLFCAGFDGRLRCSMRLHYQVQRRVVGDNSRCLTTASSTSTPVRHRANLLPNQQSKEQKFVGENTRCVATASLTSLPSAVKSRPFSHQPDKNIILSSVPRRMLGV